ncbi:uncharacterized protein LOC121408629 [Lytechinus variegatus]|uniref:uncharacterized protein LOC121408629 n=1 Tax=Lytechinus variegatus TaxID=7654 RepID=UPI001BB1885C|nr:uncharacterized protein LOC121408629 [Lytechinus variegatus]XP_041456097.1 uncharacterized protein LOC121408629 [Lytechinus variegatus]
MESCICAKCMAKYTKKLKDPMYTPQKHRKKERSVCFLSFFDMCTDTSQRDCNCTLESFNNCFSLKCISIPETSLCIKHRTQLSRFQNWECCSVCEDYIKTEDRRYSCATMVDIDKERLNNINENLSLNAESILCSSCYRYTLKQMNKPASSIDELQKMLKIEAAQHEINKTTQETIPDKVLYDVYLYVCTLCEKDKCFLLLTVYKYYVSKLRIICKEDMYYEHMKKSPSYLNGRIIHKFGDLSSTHRIARKYGLFYYPSHLSHEDILCAWHLSHSKLNKVQSNQSSDDIEMMDDESFSFTNTESDCNMQFRKIALECNELLRKQGRDITAHFIANPMSLAEFKFETAFDLFTPLIWNIICIITSTQDEIKFFKQSDMNIVKEYVQFPSEKGQASHRRKQRRVATILLLQFIINDENNYPLHVIVANCVKKMSHSTKLLKILYQIGFSCSESTLDRFLQDIHDKRAQAGPLSEIETSAFTIVSIDNVDVVTPYAAVTFDKSRS